MEWTGASLPTVDSGGESPTVDHWQRGSKISRPLKTKISRPLKSPTIRHFVQHLVLADNNDNIRRKAFPCRDVIMTPMFWCILWLGTQNFDPMCDRTRAVSISRRRVTSIGIVIITKMSWSHGRLFFIKETPLTEKTFYLETAPNYRVLPKAAIT